MELARAPEEEWEGQMDKGIAEVTGGAKSATIISLGAGIVKRT